MKLLLVVSSLNDISTLLAHYQIQPVPGEALPYLHAAKIMHHEVDILETGVGVYQVTYKVTKAISKQKYHLALKAGFGNAYKAEFAPGAALNIITERPGDYGMMVNSEWKDHYDSGLIKTSDAPHIRGGLVNFTNSYMNVFLPFKKVVGVSVNHYADKNTYQTRLEKYSASCETGDGVGFVYPCLYEHQLFYHLCFIERNLATADENFELAKQQLNSTLIDVIAKL